MRTIYTIPILNTHLLFEIKEFYTARVRAVRVFNFKFRVTLLLLFDVIITLNKYILFVVDTKTASVKVKSRLVPTENILRPSSFFLLTIKQKLGLKRAFFIDLYIFYIKVTKNLMCIERKKN